MVCSFIGHRKINDPERLTLLLTEKIEDLIVNEKVDTFLFGSRSLFDELCLEIATELKVKYPHITRIYVRAEFPYIHKDYEDLLLTVYDRTYFPKLAINAGRLVYIIRNEEMINSSDICIFYYNEEYVPKNKTKSGTKIALDYALSKKKRVTIFSDN